MKQACTHAIFCLAILTPFCVCAFALDSSLDVSQYAHNAWKIREGFTKGRINSIAQTPDGYLWLATDFGLYRFDGARNVLWQPPPGQYLPSSEILSLLAARDGTLWIGTDKGLASLKDGKVAHYPELAGVFTFTILEDRDGVVWAGAWGTPTGRLCAIQNRSTHCSGEDGILGPGVFALYEDSKGNLWAGVKDGLWRWKPGPSEFYPMPGELDNIHAFAEDDDGTLLMTTRIGISRFIDGKREPYPLPARAREVHVNRILRVREGGLWLGTSAHGIIHVHSGRMDAFKSSNGLSGDSVHSLLEDHEGNIWALTDSGLDRFREFAVPTISADQGLPSAVFGSVLATSDGSVWLSSRDGLRTWKDGRVRPARTGSPKQDGKLNGDSPNSLFQDRRGRIWVSTIHGFGYLESDRFVRIGAFPGEPVHGIAEDNTGNLWVVEQNSGLFQLSPRGDVRQTPWVVFGHKEGANALIADPVRGGLWIGFFRGGIAYFNDGAILASYGPADGLSEGAVNSFRVDDDGTLWVAAQGGLSRLKNGRLATLTSKNGLPCDIVHWMMEDDNHSVWLHMACGLVRVARSAIDAWAAGVDRVGTRTDKTPREPVLTPIQATVFDGSDGVTTSAYPGGYRPLVAKSPDGKLWFLGIDGAGVLDPRHIPFNKLPPPVHIEQIIANHQGYPVTSDANGNVRLPSLIRDLQIDYTALSFVAPEKVLFRYKLEGWESNWQDAGTRRQAFYGNLPPRNYRFRVMACNNSGVWNEAGTFLDFSIAPEYYQTWWFRALCVAVFLALFWAVYRWRVHQLRSQEKRLRDVVDTIPAMTFAAQPDGYRTFVNKGWVEYTGMTVEQSLGSGWHAVIHPEDLKGVLDEWQAALPSGRPMYYEARYRRAKDGQYRWFMVRVVGQLDRRGKIVKWYGTVTDIEDRKRAEESLCSSEAYLEEAQSLTHTGSCAIDGTSREAVYWSDEMFRIFGFDPQQGLPTFNQWLQGIHPEDREKVRLANEKTFLNKVNCDVEFRIVKPDGTVKYIHGTGHPVLSATGELVQVVGTMVDVTERKRAEEERKHAEQERERLRQLEDDMAHINRVSMLGEMAASLAHEIKQPIAATITSANTCVEWLAHEPPNLDRARAAAARIDKYGNRATEIIDRIRSLYRKSPAPRELVDMNGIIEELFSLLKCEADRFSIAMRTELCAELPRITADRVQLQQVFMNLMLNAIEAMKDSGGKLTVKSQREDSQLLFSVSDTGVGLPPEKVDQIFSAFFTTKPQGSGMGLAISRSIVESHGGRLWASANDGRGATFHFTLPTPAEVHDSVASGDRAGAGDGSPSKLPHG